MTKEQTELFSSTELKVLKVLSTRKMTIEKITKQVYKNDKKLPMNAHIVIAGLVRRINKKCEFYDLKWKLEGEGLGRTGKTFWLSTTRSTDRSNKRH